MIHPHQCHVLPTFLAGLRAWRGSRLLRLRPGRRRWTPAYRIDIALDHRSPATLGVRRPRPPGAEPEPPGDLGRRRPARYPPRRRPAPEHDGSAVFLGRLLAHKGVHFLLAGLPADMTLHVLGPEPDPVYRERLATLATRPGRPLPRRPLRGRRRRPPRPRHRPRPPDASRQQDTPAPTSSSASLFRGHGPRLPGDRLEHHLVARRS